MIPAVPVLAWSIELQIRQATFSDAPFIVNCNVSLAWETERRRLDPARVADGVRALLNDPVKGTYFVAGMDGRLAGQLLITFEWSDWRNGNFWWLQSVYVMEPFRRRGIFRALFSHIQDLAKAQKDVCGLRLYMDAQNARARHAYERLGWEPTHYEILEIDFVLTPDA